MVVREIKLAPQKINIIKRLLSGRNNRPLRSLLSKIEGADLSTLFSYLNESESKLYIEALVSINRLLEMLLTVQENQLQSLLEKLEDHQWLYILGISLESDAAYLIGHLEAEKQFELLIQLDHDKKRKIEQFLSYPEDSAGRLMHTQVFALPSHLTAEQGLQELRKRAQNESIYYIYCVDHIDEQSRPGHLEGILSLRQMATAEPQTRLMTLLKKDVISISPETPSFEVAQKVSHYKYIALPVVNTSGVLIGIVTIDDVVEIIQNQATADIYAQAGLQEGDRIFSPALESLQKRIPWMFLNLLLAWVASGVISLFEKTLSQMIILASLTNIVSGLAGNTAVQSITVVTRGLATGDFQFTTALKVILKELRVGVSMGVLSGIGAGFMVYLWKQNIMVSVVIALAMIINSGFASLTGTTTPLIIHHFRLDPAISSGVIVTVLTDIFGFFIFLGIATLGLYYFNS